MGAKSSFATLHNLQTRNEEFFKLVMFADAAESLSGMYALQGKWNHCFERSGDSRKHLLAFSKRILNSSEYVG